MIRVAIAGGTGYTGGELFRILLNHPDVQIGAQGSYRRDGFEIRNRAEQS